jgi:hypothetical protein
VYLSNYISNRRQPIKWHFKNQGIFEKNIGGISWDKNFDLNINFLRA